MACYTDWLIAERNRIANMEFCGGPNGNSGVRSYRKKADSGRHKEMGPAGEICWQKHSDPPDNFIKFITLSAV